MSRRTGWDQTLHGEGAAPQHDQTETHTRYADNHARMQVSAAARVQG